MALEVVFRRTGNAYDTGCHNVWAGTIRIGNANLEVDAKLGRLADLLGPAFVVVVVLVVGYEQHDRREGLRLGVEFRLCCWSS